MESEEGTPETGEPQGSGDPEKLFSQDDVNRIMTKEKDQGKRSGRREVLDSLGFESFEEAQAFKKLLQEADAAKLSEADRAKKEAEAEKAAAAQERLEAKRDRFAAKLERQLTTAGVQPELVGKVTRLIESDVDSTDEEITAAVAELKATMPQLFTPAQQEPKLPTGDPGRATGGKKPSDTPEKRAEARLQARHGDRLKLNSQP
jgi:signal recognition particle GTPase